MHAIMHILVCACVCARVCVRRYPCVRVRDVHDMRVGRPSFSPRYVALSLRHRVIDQS